VTKLYSPVEAVLLDWEVLLPLWTQMELVGTLDEWKSVKYCVPKREAKRLVQDLSWEMPPGKREDAPVVTI
jgi:hypothetical protein